MVARESTLNSALQHLTCGLCSDRIKSRQEGTFCPVCMSGFHTAHLASWFYTSTSRCPECSGEMDELLCRELLPRSGLERWKVEILGIVFEFTSTDTGILAKLRHILSLLIHA